MHIVSVKSGSFLQIVLCLFEIIEKDMSEKLLSSDDKNTEYSKYNMMIISDIRDNEWIPRVVSVGCTETHVCGGRE